MSVVMLKLYFMHFNILFISLCIKYLLFFTFLDFLDFSQNVMHVVMHDCNFSFFNIDIILIINIIKI